MTQSVEEGKREEEKGKGREAGNFDEQDAFVEEEEEEREAC